jgi:SAM-dependent methyltransferase
MPATPPLLFTRNWSVYQKAISRDYMLHKEFGKMAETAILSRKTNTPLTMLDLGCGDAEPIREIISKTALISYTGYDLSETALDLCRKNLQGLSQKIRLCEGSMEDLMSIEEENFSLIYSSFAIHHLPDENKKSLLQQIAAHLTPGGLFIFIDIYRKAGISRDDYISSYTNWINTSWQGFTPEEKSLIREHIENFDFPADETDIMHWCQNSGMILRSENLQDARHFCRIYKKK